MSQHSGTPSPINALRNRVDNFASMLYVDQPFTIADLPEHGERTQKLRDEMEFLRRTGALKRVDRVQKRHGTGTTTRGVYRWDLDMRDQLREYYESRTNLPCGHRVHIFNPRGQDGLSCKHCAERGDLP